MFLHTAEIPDISYWQTKTDKIVEQARISIEVQKNEYLSKAYEKAAAKDFNSALHFLRQIPKESSANQLVQQKLAEYEQKQVIRANYLLQQAYNQAELGKFDAAIKYLQQIPKGTSTYAKAQVKLVEYKGKKRSIARLDRAAASEIKSAIKNTDSFIKSKTTTQIKDFQMGTYLQEVNIQ